MAALGGFLFGFDTAVISGTEGTLRQLFAQGYASLSEMLGGSPDFWHGFTVATALIGTVTKIDEITVSVRKLSSVGRWESGYESVAPS